MVYKEIQPVAFQFHDAADLRQDLWCAPFPPAWYELLSRQFSRADGSRRRLPTTILRDLLLALDHNIRWAGTALNDPEQPWIWASQPVDQALLHLLVATWALAAVTPQRPHVNWHELLDPAAVGGKIDTVKLAQWKPGGNGTADVAKSTYRLLPSYLAERLAMQGLALGGGARPLVVGPASSDGHRSALWWPPERLPRATGDAPWSAEIEFRVKTLPWHPAPRVYVDIHLRRWVHQPIMLVPKARKLHVWLLAPQGFMRRSEHPTFVRAAATRQPNGNGEWGWQWETALSRALAMLSAHPYPSLQDILERPGHYLSGPATSAAVVYQNGMRLRRPQASEATSHDQGTPTPRRFRHPVKTGYQPIDHLDAFNQLTEFLREVGLGPVEPLPRRVTAARSKVTVRESQAQHYTLELWTQTPAMAQALVAALREELELPDPTISPDGRTLQFSGRQQITVELHEIGALAGGLPLRQSGRDYGVAESHAQRLQEIKAQLPATRSVRACVVELDGSEAFTKKGLLGDPKSTIREGFAITGRLTQFITPIDRDEESAGVADRAKSAVLDALRQLGRATILPTPPGTTGEVELIGLWLGRQDDQFIPMLVRVLPDGSITGRVLGAQEMAYPDLLLALATGSGRVSASRANRHNLVAFLREALSPSSQRNRAVFVRSATLRSRGWEWLQNQHIKADELIAPGVELPTSDTSSAGANRQKGPGPDEIWRPQDRPRLRVIRVSERDSNLEVPRVLTIQEDRAGMASGLFQHSDRVYYGLAAKPAQVRTPLGISKLQPEHLDNASTRGWNTSALEIVLAFLQPSDDPAEWAMYTQALRTAYLHTNIATQLPLPLHLAALATEYLV